MLPKVISYKFAIQSCKKSVAYLLN